jgi:hypothetical protein
MLTSLSLSIRVPTEKVVKDLVELFSVYGKCYAKVKQDGRRNLPVAFLQFEVWVIPIRSSFEAAC